MYETTFLKHSSGSVVAIDNHQPFIDELNREAPKLGLADRLDGRVGDLTEIDFPDHSFDLIWPDGAIWVLGLETGLRD